MASPACISCQSGCPVIRASPLVHRLGGQPLVIWPLRRPPPTPPPHTPETPLNPAQVCYSPNMENHTPIRRNPAGRVFRMEMRGQSAYSSSERRPQLGLSSAPVLLGLKMFRAHNWNQSFAIWAGLPQWRLAKASHDVFLRWICIWPWLSHWGYRLKW